MKDCAVIGGPSSYVLAKKVANKLNAIYIKTELQTFPDGESKLTIPISHKFKKIIVVQSTCPPVDTNIVHALLLLSKAYRFSKKVYAVVPYFGYAKQDKEFLKGEIVTLKVIANLFENVGTTKLFVVDFHSPESMNLFSIPVVNISATELLAKYFKKLKLQNPIVVSPDIVWKNHAEKFANILDASSIALNKKRDRKTGNISILSKKIQTSKNQDLIILDDMISTGNSVKKAIQFLNKKNFKKIFVACIHPVLVGNSEDMLKRNGVSEIVGTNSIQGKFSKIDLSDLISHSLKDIM